MKTAFLASTSLCALMIAAGAQAADLGHAPVYKAPPVPPPAWSWTGFYVGGTIGAVFSHDTVSNDPAFPFPFLTNPISIDATGVIGGLEVGYNWQISQAVLGLEGDVSWSSLNQSATVGGVTFSSRLDALGTARGRLGWAFDRALLYGTGGVAFADLKDQITVPLLLAATPSSSLTGWTAGGGIEYAFTDHWTVKAEYLHVGFSQRAATNSLGIGYTFDYKDALDIGRVGINYKF